MKKKLLVMLPEGSLEDSKIKDGAAADQHEIQRRIWH